MSAQTPYQLELNTYVWTLKGPDASRFLSGVSSPHINRSGYQDKQFSGRGLFLNPKGKLLAPYIFRHLAHDHVELRLDLFDQIDQINQALFNEIDSILIADKVEMTKISEKVYRVFDEEFKIKYADPFNDRSDDLLAMGGESKIPLTFLDMPSYEVWGENPGFESIESDKLNSCEFSSRYLRFPTEAQAGDLPLEFCYKDAISFFKGCYRGQETISMATFRGKLTKSLCVVESDKALNVMDEVTDKEGAKLGVIRKVVKDNFALALLKFKTPDVIETSSGQNITIVERLVPETNERFK